MIYWVFSSDVFLRADLESVIIFAALSKSNSVSVLSVRYSDQ